MNYSVKMCCTHTAVLKHPQPCNSSSEFGIALHYEINVSNQRVAHHPSACNLLFSVWRADLVIFFLSFF